MKKFLKVLKATIRQSIIYEMQYRTNFFANTFATLGWTTLSYLAINIVGSNMSFINENWSRAEYNLIWGIFFTSAQIVNTIFKRNIELIPDKIKDGDLDFVLSRPFNSKILASLGYTRLDTLFTLVFTSTVAIRSLLIVNSDVNIFLNLGILLFLLIFTSTIEYSLFISFTSLSFWLIGADNLQYLYINISNFGNYPIRAFGKLITFVFTFIFPLAFVSMYPAEALMELSLVKMLLIPLVAIITLKISDIIWNLGLRSYSSASS